MSSKINLINILLCWCRAPTPNFFFFLIAWIWHWWEGIRWSFLEFQVCSWKEKGEWKFKINCLCYISFCFNIYCYYMFCDILCGIYSSLDQKYKWYATFLIAGCAYIKALFDFSIIMHRCKIFKYFFCCWHSLGMTPLYIHLSLQYVIVKFVIVVSVS